jgi:hypothetical protein
MLIVGLSLLLLAARPFLMKRLDWRQRLGFAAKDST